MGVLLTLQIVMFAYSGVELIGVTAGEAENPAVVLPRATNGIIFRILLFYIGALVVIMALVPWNQLSPDTSPFVFVFQKVGIPGRREHHQHRRHHRRNLIMQQRHLQHRPHALLPGLPRPGSARFAVREQSERAGRGNTRVGGDHADRSISQLLGAEARLHLGNQRVADRDDLDLGHHHDFASGLPARGKGRAGGGRQLPHARGAGGELGGGGLPAVRHRHACAATGHAGGALRRAVLVRSAGGGLFLAGKAAEPCRQPEVSQSEPQLSRNLRSRHIQLIALGGTIGVGLFLGSAQAIHNAGPALLLSYLAGGVVIFFIMRALGELLTYRPVAGSFAAYADEFCGPFAGFVTGWSYWFNWVVSVMAETTADRHLRPFLGSRRYRNGCRHSSCWSCCTAPISSPCACLVSSSTGSP